MYIRPTNKKPVDPDQKSRIINEYYEHYRKIAQNNPELLNSKIERDVFSDLLNEIGGLLLKRTNELSESSDRVKQFIESNPLPKCLDDKLPPDFRVFCLAINALKQWVSAEQAATDRYVLGGTVRDQCRKAAKRCIASNEPFTDKKIELHHPVRDGRPPIPLTKEAHSQIEHQFNNSMDNKDPIFVTLNQIKKDGHRSWVMLRVGCELLLGNDVDKSKNVKASSKTFARKAKDAVDLDYSELLDWLNSNNLGHFK